MKAKSILDAIEVVAKFASPRDVETFVKRLNINQQKAIVKRDEMFCGTGELFGVPLHFAGSRENELLKLYLIVLGTLLLSDSDKKLLYSEGFTTDKSSRSDGYWLSKRIACFDIGLSASTATNAVVGFFCVEVSKGDTTNSAA